MLKSYIPKQCFPGLLRTLLEKDFGPPIRSGFESTVLYPLNMESALAKLPHAVAPDVDVMSTVVRKIIKKLGVKRKHEEVERKEEEEKEDDPDIEEQQQQPDLQQKEDCPAYTPGSYVVAVYQSDWYVGQILDKDGEPEAEGWGNDYLFISFMEKTGDLHKWPKRRDVLNTLKADVLFACQPPEICASTSSSRNTVLSLSKAESKKAKELFAQFQAYYPTKTFQLFLANCVCVCLFFHYLHTVTGYCYRTCILNVCNV